MSGNPEWDWRAYSADTLKDESLRRTQELRLLLSDAVAGSRDGMPLSTPD
ncbi:hypothetical protein ACFPM7_25550 [Actinokineospora guangxiensis]|uniref:Uncharacterized protein n=1 Tax=Actinokineospora guangxiensis TaxID=1490288 RepID=A0ABW0EW74_9PSEU